MLIPEILAMIAYIIVAIIIYFIMIEPGKRGLWDSKGDNKKKWHIIALVVITFAIRLIAMGLKEGHYLDIGFWQSWCEQLTANGMSGFYEIEVFHDYPPGYMLVLYVIGSIKNIFQIGWDSYLGMVLLRISAITCDVVTTIFVYIVANKFMSQKSALGASLIYALCPAIIINSAVWCQVDAVSTMMVVFSLYYLSEKKFYTASLWFGIAVIFKPQSLFFAPILLFAAYEEIRENKTKGVKRVIVSVATMFGAIILITIPFTKNFNFMPIVSQFFVTLEQYNYYSVNAYNIYALLHLNRIEVSGFMDWFNYAILLVAVVCSGFVYFNIKGNKKYFYSAATIIVLVFMLSIKMHERYFFPGLILLLLAWVYTKNPKWFIVFLGFSISHFINVTYVLYYFKELYFDYNPYMIISSVMALVFSAYMINIISNETSKKSANSRHIKSIK